MKKKVCPNCVSSYLSSGKAVDENNQPLEVLECPACHAKFSITDLDKVTQTYIFLLEGKIATLTKYNLNQD